jgi:hypothetical protein
MRKKDYNHLTNYRRDKLKELIDKKEYESIYDIVEEWMDIVSDDAYEKGSFYESLFHNISNIEDTY